MPSIRVTVPGLLRHTTGGDTHTTIIAATLPELLTALKRRHPLLVPLIWDESGTLRKHVLIFLNDTATKWMDDLDIPLKQGDQLAIVQAVSGG
jgi:molybdopterin converting factor small subunit